MKEAKLKERFANAFEAFFEDEKFNENDSLSITNYENSSIKQSASFLETSKTVFNIFKQIFFFLPGNLVLFFMSIVFTGFFLLRPISSGGRATFTAFFILLLTSLMTVFGLGNWREPKHYLIPLSTIIIGIVTGIVGSILFGGEGFGNFLRNYVPYFFPLAFIIPVLMKDWLDKPE